MGLFVASALVFTGCSDDDDDNNNPSPTKTAWELIQNDASLDSLEKYLSRYPGLVSYVSDSNVSVFAPDNNAFVNLLATPGFPPTIDLISPDIIELVLAYHVVPGAVTKGGLSAGDILNSVQGEAIEVNPGVGNPTGAAGTLFTGSSNAEILIKGGTKKGTNGNVNVVESVMIPPSVGATLTPILGTNAGTVLLGAAFTILAEGIGVADAYAEANSLPTLTGILSDTVIHTVFAPTDATFTAAGINGGGDLTGMEWYGTIANHVVFGDIAQSALVQGATFPTATGADTLFTVVSTPVNGVGIFFDSNGDFDPADPTTLNAEVALPDAALNSNGRVHIIAGILTPKP